MPLLADLKILYHLTLAPVRGESHAERLDSFYGGQAEAYDHFRRRLLQGRSELVDQLSPVQYGIWLDMGGGTGANIEHMGDRLAAFNRVRIIDLSTSLLAVARQRIEANRWTNVEAVYADAVTYVPPEGRADLVTFSYSLTMIPDWVAAIERAYAVLKPGGTVGVVDFYVSRKWASDGRIQHSWFTRTFWPTWFAMDNVFLSPDHLPALDRRFDRVLVAERRAHVPYMPFVTVPYYIFVGRKPA